ncbi:MAG: hypothetical protein JWO90_2816, partial [Solirubrobacterales bacterium]|nr:hypothetical protein [Solirubrobacterales bacterium]
MPLLVLAALGLLLVLSGCGEKGEPRLRAGGPTGAPASGTTGTTGARDARRPLELGISEQNVHLIAPGAAPPGFGAYRDALAALRPDRYRLVVDWSKLQPDPAVPADLALGQDGCARGGPPCAGFA